MNSNISKSSQNGITQFHWIQQKISSCSQVIKNGKTTTISEKNKDNWLDKTKLITLKTLKWF